MFLLRCLFLSLSCVSRNANFSLCHQFVADGVFYAELNELFTRELAEHGYSGVEVRVTPLRTEIIIRATRTQNVLGETSYPFYIFVIIHKYCSHSIMLEHSPL